MHAIIYVPGPHALDKYPVFVKIAPELSEDITFNWVQTFSDLPAIPGFYRCQVTPLPGHRQDLTNFQLVAPDLPNPEELKL